MRLSRLLGLVLWVAAVAKSQEPKVTTHDIQHYHQQDSQGGYRYRFKTADQMAEAEGGPNSEVKGRYAYFDKNGDMQGVEYTAGIKGYVPKILNKEEAETSILEPAITQPNTEGTVPTNDRFKNSRYQNKPSKIGREIEREDKTKQEPEISASQKDTGKTNPKIDLNRYESMNLTEHGKKKTRNSEGEIVQGKYTYIEEDGLPATIEYEAGPGIGFVVKSLTKETLQPRLVEEGSDRVYDKNRLTVEKEKSPEKSKYIEEGTEETYPEGFVRGLYTFTDEDGIPATVEYEAGPQIGFVVKNFSKGDLQLDQLGQGTGTSLNANNVIVQSSTKVEGESIKLNVSNNENPLENLKDEYSSLKPIPKVHIYQERYQNDDSEQNPSFIKTLSPQNDARIHSIEHEDLIEQLDEEKEIPMSPAYRFGFSVKDQSRFEKADTLGNVHGNFSYVDGAGLLTKVEYEAGAKKGFVIKQMTHKHTKTNSPTSEIHQTQDMSLPKKYTTQGTLFAKEERSNETNNPRQNLDETIMDGYEVSPYVLREYVDERNVPVRSEIDTESEFHDKDSHLASGSTKQLSFAHPEFPYFKSNGYYLYKPPIKNEATQKHYFPQEAITDLTTSPYYFFFRDPNYSGVQNEEPTIKSYDRFSYLPFKEPIPDNRQVYQNGLKKEVEPYRTESNQGFPVYGPPLVNLPTSAVLMVPYNMKKVRVHQQKHHRKHKKVVKRPKNTTNHESFTNLHPDGSYSFAYRTRDHSREQSIDKNGNVHYSYQTKNKRDGNTLVIFSTQIPKNVITTN